MLLLEQARQAGAAGEVDKSRDLWRKAAKGFRRLADLEENLMDRTRLHQKAKQCEAKAGAVDGTSKVKSDGSPDAIETAADEFITRTNVSFDDIGGMAEAKSQLKYAMGLLLAKAPEGVDLETPGRILMSGPPGTGKTLLAAACANTLGATFFNVKTADLMSKWYGESARMITALYRRAREVADEGIAVVFIDEVDGLISDRNKSDHSADRQIITTLLCELDGLAEKQRRPNIVTITATNQPKKLDAAFMSRIDLHLDIGLPDREAREAIFRIHIEQRGLALGSDLSYADLAKRADGLSGRDIQSMCKRALSKVLAESNADLSSFVDNGRVRDYALKLRPFKKSDF